MVKTVVSIRLPTATFFLSVTVIAGKSLCYGNFFAKIILVPATESLTLVVKQNEIKLFLFKISTGNLYVDIVPKTITVIMATSYKAMILLIKIIIVV
ncbi:MAG: hypothetical protein K2K65_03835, partial [Duncaniella sp.]|nr:hypothetical protein [Duncaniella sp.]